jgi:hypothetical protein
MALFTGRSTPVSGAMNRKSLWQFLKDVFTQWIEDDPFLLASSLSYYTLFSLAPLLVIAIAVAGLVFGREAAQNQIVETIGGMIGPESAHAIQGMIQYASNKPKTGTISTVLGAVALLFGAGGVVGQLTTALNKIWGGCAEIWPRGMGFCPTTVYFICNGFSGGFSSLGFSCCDRARNGSFAIYGELDRRSRLCCPSTRHCCLVRFCYTPFRDDL